MHGILEKPWELHAPHIQRLVKWPQDQRQRQTVSPLLCKAASSTPRDEQVNKLRWITEGLFPVSASSGYLQSSAQLGDIQPVRVHQSCEEMNIWTDQEEFLLQKLA